jgi:hypothetical protein
MEGADEILAVARIDAGLAADRGIDLGEQGRRHLDEAHAPAHHGGRKAREIPHHAAAERHDEIPALDPGGQHRIADLFQARIGFGGLARRKRDQGGAQPLRFQGIRKCRGV